MPREVSALKLTSSASKLTASASKPRASASKIGRVPRMLLEVSASKFVASASKLTTSASKSLASASKRTGSFRKAPLFFTASPSNHSSSASLIPTTTSNSSTSPSNCVHHKSAKSKFTPTSPCKFQIWHPFLPPFLISPGGVSAHSKSGIFLDRGC